MTTTTRAMRRAAVAVAAAMMFSLAVGFAPVQTAAATPLSSTFHSGLTNDATAGSVLVNADSSLAKTNRAATRTATIIQKAVAAGPRTTRTAAGAKAPTTSVGSKAPATAAPVDETARARSILAGYISKHPSLAGTTVSFGDAKGNQAICYYKSGRIVISPTHKASLDRIIGHEIWHVIDWRDNGVIDWGENVPPR